MIQIWVCVSIHHSFQSLSCFYMLSLSSCLPLPDVSQSGSSPFVLLLDGCGKPLSSKHFQLSHFFRVHGAGFSPLHQIFIEGETGDAGFATCLSVFHPSIFHSSLQMPLKSPWLSLSFLSFTERSITNIFLWYSYRDLKYVYDPNFEWIFVRTIVFVWYFYDIWTWVYTMSLAEVEDVFKSFTDSEAVLSDNFWPHVGSGTSYKQTQLRIDTYSRQSNISSHLELCFWPLDKWMFNVESSFTSVLASSNSFSFFVTLCLRSTSSLGFLYSYYSTIIWYRQYKGMTT